MIVWLQSEIGGLMIAVLGGILRIFAENHENPARIVEKRGTVFLVRVLASAIAGLILLALIPPDLANYIRVSALAFVGAATPELVRLFVRRGLDRADTIISDKIGKGTNESNGGAR